jgi:hypothetical protein
MKDSLFTEMMAGFAEAAKHRGKQSAALRLLTIAKKKPAALLEFVA